MRKRDSLRRWKARCRLGRYIPKVAIYNFRLNKWFFFDPVNPHTEFYIAREK